MTILKTLTPTKFLGGLVLMALAILLSTPAKADTIENLVFAGTATCEPAINAICSSFGSGPLTGTYSLNVDTQTIVGPWSFSMPFGVLSSTDTGASTVLVDRFGDINPAFVVQTTSPLFSESVQFFFPGTDTQQIGLLATNALSDACVNLPGGANGGPSCAPDYVVSGTTSLASTTTTPEPSSLVLLGAGMLGLVGGKLRKHRLNN